MTTRRSRAKVPSPADQQARADMRRARAAVRPGSRPTDARTGRARTQALPPLSELELTTDEMADEIVSVSQAAELLEISQQAVNQTINRGSLPAFQHEGQRAILLDDLAESRTGRAQAARLADERHMRAWAEHRHATIPRPDCRANGFENCHLCAEPAPAEEPGR